MPKLKNIFYVLGQSVLRKGRKERRETRKALGRRTAISVQTIATIV